MKLKDNESLDQKKIIQEVISNPFDIICYAIAIEDWYLYVLKIKLNTAWKFKKKSKNLVFSTSFGIYVPTYQSARQDWWRYLQNLQDFNSYTKSPGW